jgi:hypothetical protein
MRQIRRLLVPRSGGGRPLLGPMTPTLLASALVATLSLGCGDQQAEQSLPLLQVGMTKAVPPIYDDGEMQIFEVKKGLAFPILAPSGDSQAMLGKKDVEPYGREPWVTVDDIQVQVTWTLTNLDDEQHIVEVLLDPWNEFGRYFPGLQLTDPDEQQYMPNFSGIDKRYIAAGKAEGEASRVHDTYTFADLNETAVDLATVMDLIKNPPPMEDGMKEDPTVTYTNHAFHWQNRSYNDLLIKSWVPSTIAGLTGLDLGFRTSEPATIAIEIAVEVVDKNGKRVRPEGDKSPLLAPTKDIITVGVAAP